MNLLPRSICILVFLSVMFNPHSEGRSPVRNDSLIVGKPFPAIILKKILYFKSKQISSTSLKGKWLILDFWTRGCSYCVERFPTMNALNTKYHDKLNIFLIGKPGYHIEQMYEKFRKNENLALPISYDSTLFNKFRIRIVPYVIIIDPRGVVRAITIKLDDQDFQSFLNGKEPQLQSALNIDQEKALDNEFDPDKLLFISNNGGPDTSFLFRSVLGRWIKSMPTTGSDFPAKINNFVQVTGQTIADLYMMAYGDTITAIPYRTLNSYGKFWPFPSLHVKDTLKFKPNLLTGENLYCYSQSAPQDKMTNRQIQERMRGDLQNFFGYKVNIVEEKKPCLNLELIGDSTKNFGPRSDEYIKEEDDLYEGPLEFLPASIWYHIKTHDLIFDMTGLDKKRWIRLDVILSNIGEINMGLKKYGMEIRSGERKVKVIVLSDR